MDAELPKMSISSTGLSHHGLHGGKPITVTVAMAKKLSGLGNTTIWALIKAGKLEAVRIGRRTLVTFRSLETLLEPGRDV
jgi:excisionase family DNA binding protein